MFRYVRYIIVIFLSRRINDLHRAVIVGNVVLPIPVLLHSVFVVEGLVFLSEHHVDLSVLSTAAELESSIREKRDFRGEVAKEVFFLLDLITCTNLMFKAGT